MANGFVKLNKKMLGWKWLKHPPTVVVWIVLLMKAEWNTDNGYKPGQVVITSQELEEITGLTRQQIRTAIQHLESTHEVTKGSTTVSTKGSTKRVMLLTIENWRLYQHDHTKSTKGSTKDSTKGSTNLLLYKENKEVKEDKEEKPAGTTVEAVPMPDEFKAKLETMFNMRKDN